MKKHWMYVSEYGDQSEQFASLAEAEDTALSRADGVDAYIYELVSFVSTPPAKVTRVGKK